MRVGVLSDLPRATLFFSCLALFLLSGLCLPQASLAMQIEVDGRAYIALPTVGNHFGMGGHWHEVDKVYRLSSRQTTVDFTKNSRFTQINRMPVYLGFSTVELEGQLYIAVTDYQHVLQPILTPQVFEDKPEIQRVVIDVGHGGKDNGARNDAYGLLEKDLNLDVAIRLKRLLEKSGFQVKLTRTKDVFIPLEKRSEIANRFGADFFISLHFNSAASSEPSGFEVFALTPQNQPSTKNPRPTAQAAERFPGNNNDPWNMLAAYHVERALVQGLGGPDRGVKRARFSVLKYLDCPGVLVELGFLSHTETAKKLRSTDFRQLIAESLCQGVLIYRARLQRIQ
ncbi:MAG: N-acetylmuramoyl-L-alanine amidase [Lentimonas sp.]|jgi:N-acetylmuramoyl-L-alanine amidase